MLFNLVQSHEDITYQPSLASPKFNMPFVCITLYKITKYIYIKQTFFPF